MARERRRQQRKRHEIQAEAPSRAGEGGSRLGRDLGRVQIEALTDAFDLAAHGGVSRLQLTRTQQSPERLPGSAPGGGGLRPVPVERSALHALPEELLVRGDCLQIVALSRQVAGRAEAFLRLGGHAQG